MKNNYRAWEIHCDDFFRQATDRDRLKFLVRFAVLAPSSHNSQPWRFEVGENEIVVKPDMQRALPVSDVNHRQLYISIGCAIENIVVAADYYGFHMNVHYAGLPEGTEVRILCGSADNAPIKDLRHSIFSIPQRATNRAPYRSNQISTSFCQRVCEYADAETEVHLISDSGRKEKIADVVVSALVAAMDDAAFRRELSGYLMPGITRSMIGMPGTGFGMPLPVSFVAPAFVRFVNVNRLNRKKDKDLLVGHTPVFAVIATQGDAPGDWIRAGRVYQRIALEATREGIATHPMAAAIQIGEYYRDLQRLVPTALRPQLFFRMGYTDREAIASPRIPADMTIYS